MARVRFGARGKVAGREVEVWWADGDLEGPSWAVDHVKRVADNLTGARLGRPNGPWTSRDYLDFWWSASEVLGRSFDGPFEWLGETPEVPAPPEGAVE